MDEARKRRLKYAGAGLLVVLPLSFVPFLGAVAPLAGGALAGVLWARQSRATRNTGRDVKQNAVAGLTVGILWTLVTGVLFTTAVVGLLAGQEGAVEAVFGQFGGLRTAVVNYLLLVVLVFLLTGVGGVVGGSVTPHRAPPPTTEGEGPDGPAGPRRDEERKPDERHPWSR